MKVIERWTKIIAPLIVIILIIVIGNMLAAKAALTTIIVTLFPFMFSFLIAWILNPVVEAVVVKFKIKRWLSAVIVLSVIFIIFTGIFIIVVPEFINQFKILAKYVPTLRHSFRNFLDVIDETFGIEFANNIFERFSSQITSIISRLFTGGLDVIASSINFVGGVVSGVFIIFMMLMAAVYILIDFDRLEAGAISLIPKRMLNDFNFLIGEVNRVVVGYLRGLIIETVIVFIISYITFVIIGIEGALVFAVIVGLTNVIPYFGPYIGGIPVVLFAATVSWEKVIIVIVALIVIQQIDGILVKPKVFGKTVSVHPALSIIAVILFGNLFGFIGVVFAIPIIGLVIVFIKFIYHKLVEKYPEVLT